MISAIALANLVREKLPALFLDNVRSKGFSTSRPMVVPEQGLVLTATVAFTTLKASPDKLASELASRACQSLQQDPHFQNNKTFSFVEGWSTLIASNYPEATYTITAKAVVAPEGVLVG